MGITDARAPLEDASLKKREEQIENDRHQTTTTIGDNIMRTGNVSPRVDRFKKASTKPTKTNYVQDKLNKLRRDIPSQRPQVQGTTYQPLRIETNAKATSTPIKQETYSTKLHVTPEQKLRASRAKPQPKPHGAMHIIHTVIRNKPSLTWTAEQRKAWRKHNKTNPNHIIHF